MTATRSSMARLRLIIAWGVMAGGCCSPMHLSGREGALSPDGRVFAARLWGHAVLLDTKNGKELARFEGPPAGKQPYVCSIAFSPDGGLLVVGGIRRAVLWDVVSRRERAVLDGHTSSVCAVAFSPDGHALATAGCDWTIRLWELPEARLRARIYAHPREINSLAFSPDGRTLASAGAEGTVLLTNVADGSEVARFYVGPYAALYVAYSPDGALLAVGQWRCIRLLDAATGAEELRIEGHDWGVYDAIFSPDGAVLLTRSSDGQLKRWDAATGRPLPPMPPGGLGSPVLGLATNADSTKLAVVRWGRVMVWDFRTWDRLANINLPNRWWEAAEPPKKHSPQPNAAVERSTK